MSINLKEIRQGDVFSESSVYRFESVQGNQYTFTHVGSGQRVTLDNKYVENLLVTADQFNKEVFVGKEDKHWTQAQIDAAVKKNEIKVGEVNVGDLRQAGIRTIFENIGNQVFTVCFQKADKLLSKKAYDAKVAQAASDALAKLEAAKAGKKSVVNAANTVIEELLRNPILKYEPGEERILRGYKQQFASRDGRYNCMDLNINETRPVNINTLIWVVVDGVKYIVE